MLFWFCIKNRWSGVKGWVGVGVEENVEELVEERLGEGREAGVGFGI